VTLPIGGRYGLPSHGVSAALVSLIATSKGAAGAIDGWAAGTTRPAVPVLSYAAGTTAGTELISLPGGAGIALYNTGTAPVTVTVTLLGAYFRGPSRPCAFPRARPRWRSHRVGVRQPAAGVQPQPAGNSD
jgi:hypothetical protein